MPPHSTAARDADVLAVLAARRPRTRAFRLTPRIPVDDPRHNACEDRLPIGANGCYELRPLQAEQSAQQALHGPSLSHERATEGCLYSVRCESPQSGCGDRQLLESDVVMRASATSRLARRVLELDDHRRNLQEVIENACCSRADTPPHDREGNRLPRSRQQEAVCRMSPTVLCSLQPTPIAQRAARDPVAVRCR